MAKSAEFERVYYVKTQDRQTIIVDMICPACYGIITTDGDIVSMDYPPAFIAVPQCNHCYKVFPAKGLLPNPKRTARKWHELYVYFERKNGHTDIIQCFYETVHKDIRRSGGGSSGKCRKKAGAKFERHCGYWES